MDVQLVLLVHPHLIYQYSNIKQLLRKDFLTKLADRTDILMKLISNNGGKVRVFPAVNRGPDYGYQYVERLPLGKSLRFLRNQFDIDLSQPDALRKIRYLAAFSMIYWNYGVHQVKTNLMMIMKPQGASLTDPSIAAFTHDKIFRLTSIDSKDGAPGGDGYTLLPITGSLSTEGIFALDPFGKQNPNVVWRKTRFFFPMSHLDFMKDFDPSLWD